MEKEQLIILIVFFSALSLLVAIFLVAVFLIQRTKTNKFILEKELRQQQYETQLLKIQIEVQEDTRKNIGMELHDNIGQLLSLTHLTIASIDPGGDTQTAQKINDSKDLIKRSIGELRQLSKVLHGEMLLKEGLEDAIRNEITWLQRNNHFQVHFSCLNELQSKTDKDKDLFVFRLLQECLNNIIKHADARKIDIILQYDTDQLYLKICDDGKGFDVHTLAPRQTGLGINNMQTRMRLLKGIMSIESSAGKGTQIAFWIPYP